MPLPSDAIPLAGPGLPADAIPLPTTTPEPKPTAPPAERSLARELVQPVLNVGQSLLDVGRAAASLPGELAGRYAKAKDIDWRETLTRPDILWEAAKGTGKELYETGVKPLVEQAPTLVGMGMGAMAGSPTAGAMGGRYLQDITRYALGENVTPEQMYENAATTGLMTGLPMQAPRAATAAARMTGRALALPVERQAVAGAGLQAIPERIRPSTAPPPYAESDVLARTSTTATSVPTFRSQVKAMANQIAADPYETLRSGDLLKKLQTLQEQIGDQGGVTAREIGRAIQDVNNNIQTSVGAERGAWKQMLAGLHEDLRVAAPSDPAFRSLDEAVRQQRLQYLADDLRGAVTKVGFRPVAKGSQMAADPGKIIQWMRTNPDWMGDLEKVSPGLSQDLMDQARDLVPVANVKPGSVTGTSYGSGQFTLGAAIGALVGHFLGLSPAQTAQAGLATGTFNVMRGNLGIHLPPDYVRWSFSPSTGTPSSPALGVAGAALSRPVDLTQPLAGKVEERKKKR